MTSQSGTTPSANDTEEIWTAGPAGQLHAVGTRTPGPPNGEPVLFVHCFAGDASFWGPQLAHVAQGGRRGVAIELRGHGRSAPAADDDYGIAGFARDVQAVADALGWRRFVLVAHSMGAAVAGELAGTHPDRVSALVLVDPAGDNTKIPGELLAPLRKTLQTDGYRQAVAQYLETQLPHARPGVRARLLGGLERAPRALVVGATLASIDYSVLPMLDRYRSAQGRALTITADQNQGPLALHTLRPDLPRRNLPGTSHYIALDEPDAFNVVLDRALDGSIWQR